MGGTQLGRPPACQAGAEPGGERQTPATGTSDRGGQPASGAGSGWWGENALQASSSMTVSLNRKLARKRRLSASPAAWRGGANSSGHRPLPSHHRRSLRGWDGSSPFFFTEEFGDGARQQSQRLARFSASS